MHLFLKKFIAKEKTIYCKNGILYEYTDDMKDGYYDAKYLVSDGKLYDLENREDINRIPIPKFPSRTSDITKSLDYILRAKARYLHDRNEKEICSAMLWKSTKLMVHSPVSWNNEDYKRIIYYHNELGLFEEAKRAESFLKTLPYYGMSVIDETAFRNKEYIFSLLESCGEDLVIFPSSNTPCCSECSKLRGRAYSVYGNNKKFPILPERVRVKGNFHSNCRCTMLLWSESLKEISDNGEKKNVLEMSWRPYIDTRNQEQREAYEKFLEKYDLEQKELQNRYIYSIRRGICQIEYDKILELMPDKAPKSIKGYMRMKKMRTKNFLKLKESADKLGFFIAD